MTITPKYKCDGCEKTIEEGFEQLWMITLTMVNEESVDDGSAGGHDTQTRTFHFHADCAQPIWSILL